MNFDYLLKHSELFPAVIGISKRAFDQLVRKVHPVLFLAFKVREIKPRRIRAAGAGRKRTFDTEEKLVFSVLLYYKVYPTFRFAQVLFELDKNNVRLWIKFMTPVLSEALQTELKLPTKKIKCLDELITICPDLAEFLVDATERRIQRPKDKTAQEFYYSGKKKYHTVKNQLLVSPRTKKILSVSKTVEGKRHDKKLAEDDSTILRAPPGAIGMGDSGYQGAQDINGLIKIVYPKRKPKGKELTPEEKSTNKQISRIRVRVEHPLAWLKHFNILSHTYRNSVHSADAPFHTIAALYNFTR